MKKIVPFNNVLSFNTDVADITGISLEHKIDKSEDVISGIFYISGEYKMTNGEVEKHIFNFDLPFDIALGANYDMNTLLVDVDDFRYEIIDKKKVKVNIDLYIDGEEISSNRYEEIHDNEEDNKDTFFETIDIKEDLMSEIINDRLEEDDILEEGDDMNIDDKIISNKNDNNIVINENIENKNEEVNVFNGFNEEEKYVTYKVYRVMEGDTIDSILEKYKVTKELLENYNIIDQIKPGDKLIIPSNE